MVTVSGKTEYFHFSWAVISVWILLYINVGNLWKFSKDPISRRDHHHWFWGIQISYLRYVNYLQPGLHREKYRTLAVKNFQIWSLTLDPIQSSTIWTYEPLPTYGHLLVESHHSNVRKTLLWLFVTLLCWLRTTKCLLEKCYLVFYSSHQACTYSP